MIRNSNAFLSIKKQISLFLDFICINYYKHTLNLGLKKTILQHAVKFTRGTKALSVHLTTHINIFEKK